MKDLVEAELAYHVCAPNDPVRSMTHPTQNHHLHTSRHNSTNMDPIQKAIEDIESRDRDTSFSYREVAKRYGISHRTLARRHQGQTQPRGLTHRFLNPEHETELVQYIKSLTDRRIPPTRSMIRSYATKLAKRDVSESWVTRFMNRNSHHLISRWQRGMDRDRHKADSGARYKLYFDLLHDKMAEYQLEARNIYNMDERAS